MHRTANGRGRILSIGDCLSSNRYRQIATRLSNSCNLQEKYQSRLPIAENYSGKTFHCVRNSALARFKYPCIRLFVLPEQYPAKWLYHFYSSSNGGIIPKDEYTCMIQQGPMETAHCVRAKCLCLLLPLQNNLHFFRNSTARNCLAETCQLPVLKSDRRVVVV